jgi:23S rRNA pseudouridine2605 synthase
MQERIQKIIAGAGICSRRRAEELIVKGKVSVNGRVVTKLGAKADPDKDEIRVDGNLVSREGASVYIMLHKPEGYITTTRDPEGRPTVMDLLGKQRARIFPVGRLDWDTSGIILLTNDGELAQRLTHPSFQAKKTYEVKVKGVPDEGALSRLRKGVSISEKRSAPADVRIIPAKRGKHTWLRISLVEGMNRQVRRMCQAVGHPVMKLKRTGIGPLRLEDLPAGTYRHLNEKEVSMLKSISAVREKSHVRKSNG